MNKLPELFASHRRWATGMEQRYNQLNQKLQAQRGRNSAQQPMPPSSYPSPAGQPSYPPPGTQGYPPPGTQAYPPPGTQGYPPPSGQPAYPQPAGQPMYQPPPAT